jgi:hypothetical protein
MTTEVVLTPMSGKNIIFLGQEGRNQEESKNRVLLL